MAIADKLTTLGTAQAFTSSGGVATDAFPLPATGANYGDGEPLGIEFIVTTAALKSGTEAYTFQAVTATASDGTTGQVVIAQSGVYTASSGAFAQKQQLAVGDRIIVAIPYGTIPATATYITGKVVLASSAGISCTTRIGPLAAMRAVQAYAATETV